MDFQANLGWEKVFCFSPFRNDILNIVFALVNFWTVD